MRLVLVNQWAISGPFQTLPMRPQVIARGPIQFPPLGNVYPPLLTSQTVRNKSIPSILSAALLLAVLMAPLASADSGDETITVNHVVLVDTPPHPEWEWNYSYQVEVSDLQMDVNYIEVILYKQTGDDGWRADWW